MDFVAINPLAVLAAAVAGFAFGAAWYSTLSGPWLRAVGLTREQLAESKSAKPFVIAGLAQLVMAAVLAWFLGHAAGGPAEPAELTWYDGLRVGFLAWLGFVITTLAVNHGFQGARRALTVLDGGHWLGVLLIQGLVLAAIGA